MALIMKLISVFRCSLMFCQLMSPILPRHDSVVLSETQTVINDILFVCVYNLYNAPIIFRNTDSGLNLYMWCFQGIKKKVS